MMDVSWIYPGDHFTINVNQTITLYTLNSNCDACQLFLNKALLEFIVAQSRTVVTRLGKRERKKKERRKYSRKKQKVVAKGCGRGAFLAFYFGLRSVCEKTNTENCFPPIKAHSWKLWCLEICISFFFHQETGEIVWIFYLHPRKAAPFSIIRHWEGAITYLWGQMPCVWL